MSNKSLNEKLNDAKKFIRSFRGSDKDDCFFEDCNNRSIKSHSISESRVLSILEDIDEKKARVIYHLENVPEADFGDAKSISTYHQTHRKLLKKGKGDTSVFYGFCSSCDGFTFNLIDNVPYQNNSQVNFQHTLRTKAHYLTTSKNIFQHMRDKIVSKFYEADGKVNELKGAVELFDGYLNQISDNELVQWDHVSVLRTLFNQNNTAPLKSFREDSEKRTQELFRELMDETKFPMKGSQFKSEFLPVLEQLDVAFEKYEQSSTQELEGVISLLLDTINIRIQKLTSQHRNNDCEAYEYLHISISGIFPIAGAFVYCYTEEKECTLTFFPEEETVKTHVIFAVDRGESKYLSFLNFKTNEQLRIYLSSIILSAGSNVFISPKYWESLPNGVIQLIMSDKTEVKECNLNLFDESFLI